MNRRQLLTATVGLLALSKLPPAIAADEAVPFTPEVYQEALDSGEPFMLDFYAAW